MTRAARLGALQLALLAVLGAAQGCSRPGSGSNSAAAATGSYRAGGVSVTVALVRGRQNEHVVVTFTPDIRGFHLYGTALDRRQAHGLGVATAVSVQGGLRATGPLTADKPVRMLRIAALRAALPVFPDGPVSIVRPVRAAGSRPAVVVVSFAACSARVCLMPVIDHRIRLETS